MRTAIIALFIGVLTVSLNAGGARAGGTDVGGTDGGSAFVTSWCNDQFEIMDEAWSEATMQTEYGDLNGAIATLRQGMLDAASRATPETLRQSLTFKAITRGLELERGVEEAVQTEVNRDETTLQFLRHYYGFVRCEVAGPDLTYNIPYQYRSRTCRNCPQIDMAQYEKSFVDYARREVAWVLELFVPAQDGTAANECLRKYNGPSDKPAEAAAGSVVRWSVKGYLKALELSTAFAAQDLDDSLWRAGYACTQKRLHSLSDKLATFNFGNRAPYMNQDPIAVKRSFADARDIISTINLCK